jgi:tRNA A37 threonylcarbamoyltransferase TsaD
VPEVSKEFHEKELPGVVQEALTLGNIKKGDKRLKAIAVTIGPG